MRKRFAQEDGLARAVFLIVAVWAVMAVGLLTGTLVSAQQIDRKVVGITKSVSEIDDDTTSVELLMETRRVASAIDQAAKPLSGQLDQVAQAAGGIDQSAASIKGNVDSINAAVNSIDAHATSINTTVKAIDGKAGSIEQNAKGIDATAKSIAAPVGEINASAKGILGNFSAILDVARSIDRRLVDTTSKADGILAVARAIQGDLANIFRELGPGHGKPGVLTLHGHANSIDCSGNTLLVGPSTYCDK